MSGMGAYGRKTDGANTPGKPNNRDPRGKQDGTESFEPRQRQEAKAKPADGPFGSIRRLV